MAGYRTTVFAKGKICGKNEVGMRRKRREYRNRVYLYLWRVAFQCVVNQGQNVRLYVTRRRLTQQQWHVLQEDQDDLQAERKHAMESTTTSQNRTNIFERPIFRPNRLKLFENVVRHSATPVHIPVWNGLTVVRRYVQTIHRTIHIVQISHIPDILTLISTALTQYFGTCVAIYIIYVTACFLHDLHNICIIIFVTARNV